MASGDTLRIWTAREYGDYASGNIATQNTRNSHYVNDLALSESVIFGGVMPRHYDGGGITIYLHYAMRATIAIADDINIQTNIERIGDQLLDLDSNSFGAASNTGDITVPGTSGLVDIVSTAHTAGGEMDLLAVGEAFRMLVSRAAVAGTDAIGDLELLFVEMAET